MSPVEGSIRQSLSCFPAKSLVVRIRSPETTVVGKAEAAERLPAYVAPINAKPKRLNLKVTGARRRCWEGVVWPTQGQSAKPRCRRRTCATSDETETACRTMTILDSFCIAFLSLCRLPRTQLWLSLPTPST